MTVSRVEDGTNSVTIHCNEREARQIAFILAMESECQAKTNAELTKLVTGSVQSNIYKHFAELYDEFARNIIDQVGL